MKTKFYQLTNKSFDELGVSTHKDLWQKAQEQGYTALTAAVETAYEKSADDENRFHFIFSTAAEDRHGDVVEQNWELARFKKNPVVLDSHNYWGIEHILGKISKASVKEKRLQGDVEFMLDNPKGALAQKMVVGGFLNATSVGFIPKEFDNEGRILKSELLEVSMVSVPANFEALAEKTTEATVDEPEADPVPPTPEPEPVQEPSPVKGADVLISVAHRQRSLLNDIARELQKTNPSNLAERKRKIFQQLREVLQSQG